MAKVRRSCHTVQNIIAQHNVDPGNIGRRMRHGGHRTFLTVLRLLVYKQLKASRLHPTYGTALNRQFPFRADHFKISRRFNRTPSRGLKASRTPEANCPCKNT